VAIVHENQTEKKVIGGVGSKNIQKEIRTEMVVFEQQDVKGPNLSKCEVLGLALSLNGVLQLVVTLSLSCVAV
jgi:hypothetical protein